MHEQCLSFTLTSFLTAGWISERQLQSMIEGLSHKDQALVSIITLQLLHLNHQQYFQPKSFEINLAKILQTTAPLADFSSPLSFLASGDLPGFQTFCQKSDGEQLRRVGRASMGLFPPAGDGKAQCLYSPKDKRLTGNPGWIWARKSLKDYYKLKASKMEDQLKEIYGFLLSSQELINPRAKPFQNCWAALYLYYNRQILQQYLQEFTDPKVVITWSSISLEQTFQHLQRSFEHLSAQQRIPYFLALNLLNANREIASFIPYSPLEASFHLFLQTYSQIQPELQLMMLLFYLECAERQSLPGIADQCRSQYIKLLGARQPKASIYISFFLPLEETSKNLISLRLSPTQVPTNPRFRQRLYDLLLQQGRTYPEGILQLSQTAVNNHFLSALKLTDPLKGEQLIIQAGRAVDLWVQRLSIELPSIAREDIEQAFVVFLETWSNYYIFLKGNKLDDLYSAMESFEYLKEILPLPRSSPEAAFNILMCSVETFRQQVFHEQLIAQFESEVVANLLSILPSSKADIFQQEWNALTSHNSRVPAQLPQG